MFGKYASFVVPAYALSMLALAIVIVRIRVIYRQRLAELNALEMAGAGRRSAKKK